MDKILALVLVFIGLLLQSEHLNVIMHNIGVVFLMVGSMIYFMSKEHG